MRPDLLSREREAVALSTPSPTLEEHSRKSLPCKFLTLNRRVNNISDAIETDCRERNLPGVPLWAGAGGTC